MTANVKWAGYPKSYTPGRNRPVQFVTLHYTAGSEGPTSAEAGVQYDKVRTDGTSAHIYTDSSGPGLQEVPYGDRAHTARKHGNEIGVHIEICGTVQTRAQWLDAVSLPTLQTTAGIVSSICDELGLAKRRLTTAETRAAYYNPTGQRPTGINDHNACTLAFPEDGGTHTDVGPEFPWDVFMDMVLAGGEDMTPVQNAMLTNVDSMLWNGMINLHDRVRIPFPGDNPNAAPIDVDNQFAIVLKGIAAAAGLTPEQLEEIATAAREGAASAPQGPLSDADIQRIEDASFRGAQRAESS